MTVDEALDVLDLSVDEDGSWVERETKWEQSTVCDCCDEPEEFSVPVTIESLREQLGWYGNFSEVESKMALRVLISELERREVAMVDKLHGAIGDGAL